jgi:hypothetical protein
MASIITRARKRLGAARQELLYGRDNRSIAKAAQKALSEWTEDVRLRLPALPPRPAMPVFEVHCVSGEKQMPMTGWCCWSLMRFMPDAQLVLHDDGSLTEASRDEMQRIVPGMRLVGREERAEAMRAAPGVGPNILHWVETYHLGFKHTVQFTARAPRILEIDSDLLTYLDPVSLRGHASAPEPTSAWNRDIHYNYAYPEPLFEEILGDLIGPLPERLNGGLVLLDLYTAEEWQRLEEILSRLHADPRTDPLRFWMQQTLHALIVSRRQGAKLVLPAEYDIYHGPSRPQSVVRHFVGSPRTRPRFFTEGIPRLISEARISGHLPEDFAADRVPP